ncbi:GAF domain-containing sensor histidine kinase [Hufsiella ginkgonis]|uniref:histidine kinase n=1 Tax=Hufsiella ginkgonis TaxID=2695274 RepID=A0A7K1Y1V0_9SPHI|nr:GAF domain-containing sensor histidine kinase [Hufsiella ginkgonis]MXV17058.1 GAF domain-containing protein [Hufsiella ginkgonis]
MNKTERTVHDFQADIDAIENIPVVNTILEVICRTTGMGFAAIARVTEDRWVACAVRDEIAFGLVPGGELKVETTICHEIRQHERPVVIDQVSLDPEYADHHTVAMYGFQSYISVPIMLKNGSFFGTLCAIDPRPASLNNSRVLGMFNLYADLIAFHLQGIERLLITQVKLSEELKSAELREQFIAILGHDLRNPVGAVGNAAQLLLRMPLDERAQRLVHIIQDSSYRMRGMIENVLDFARGRLGGGIALDISAQDLDKILNEVIMEMAVIWPDREVRSELNFDRPVNCDGGRIAQLFANLLGNALSHGSTEGPVVVRTRVDGGDLVLSVINSGDKIPEHALARLFHPFSRGTHKPGQQGLGLGLFIASEIASAHRGSLEVRSTEEETCFTLRMNAGGDL